MQRQIYDALIGGLIEVYGAAAVRRWRSVLRALTAADGSSADLAITERGVDAECHTRAGDVTICADLASGRYWIRTPDGPVECREYLQMTSEQADDQRRARQ